MGAKTALLAFTDGDIRTALRGVRRSDSGAAQALARRAHPGYTVEAAGKATLDRTYPPEDITHVLALAGAEVLIDQRFMLDYPSRLPEHLLALGAGRRVILHAMHSVVDWLAFAVWEDGTLARSLSVAPDGGILENIGGPYDFERPYWAGEHPAERAPAGDDEPCPLPFHPLDFGEEALRALFGFVIEGRPQPGDVKARKVPMHAFRVTDPSGQEQAERAADYARARAALGPARTFRVEADGERREVTPEGPGN
ncbi:MAG TPA: hypothetical protein VH478_13580 [Trebonia sp.]|nr:hypothetical protein [Trebonia sp.]